MTHPPLNLRIALPDDDRLLFAWANDSVIREASFSPKPIRWEDHVQWFQRKLADPLCRIYIGLNEREHPIGYVRFEWTEKDAVVSIGIDVSVRGKGYGKSLLRYGMQKFFLETHVITIHAYAKPENTSSLRLFRGLGYDEIGIVNFHDSPAVHFVFHRHSFTP